MKKKQSFCGIRTSQRSTIGRFISSSNPSVKISANKIKSKPSKISLNLQKIKNNKKGKSANKITLEKEANNKSFANKNS